MLVKLVKAVSNYIAPKPVVLGGLYRFKTSNSGRLWEVTRVDERGVQASNPEFPTPLVLSHKWWREHAVLHKKS